MSGSTLSLLLGGNGGVSVHSIDESNFGTPLRDELLACPVDEHVHETSWRYNACAQLSHSEIVVGTDHGVCCIFDIESGELIRQFGILRDREPVNGTTYLPSSQTIVTGAWHEHTVKCWHRETVDLKCELSGHTSRIYCLDCDEWIRPNVVVSGSGDRSVRVWDIGSEKCIFVGENAHGGGIVRMCHDSEKQMQFSGGSWDKSVTAWDYRTNESIFTLVADEDSVVNSVSCMPAQSQLMMFCFGGLIYVYDYRKVEGSVSSVEDMVPVVNEWNSGHTGSVCCCSLPDLGVFATVAYGDQHIRTWNAVSHECVCDTDLAEFGFSQGSRGDNGRILMSPFVDWRVCNSG